MPFVYLRLRPSPIQRGRQRSDCVVKMRTLKVAHGSHLDEVAIQFACYNHVQLIPSRRLGKQFSHEFIAGRVQPVKFFIVCNQAIDLPLVVVLQRAVLMILERLFGAVPDNSLYTIPIGQVALQLRGAERKTYAAANRLSPSLSTFKCLQPLDAFSTGNGKELASVLPSMRSSKRLSRLGAIEIRAADCIQRPVR